MEYGRGRTDDGACLYYNLINEPKGSGERIQTCVIMMSNVKKGLSCNSIHTLNRYLLGRRHDKIKLLLLIFH